MERSSVARETQSRGAQTCGNRQQGAFLPIELSAQVSLALSTTIPMSSSSVSRLQVILCFSPVGSILRVRARKFPAVVNCTAINWFHEWPEDALVSVSARFLEETEGIHVSHWAQPRPPSPLLVFTEPGGGGHLWPVTEGPRTLCLQSPDKREPGEDSPWCKI